MAGSMTGMTLNNRYQLIERVGIGGMAEVYRAHDTVLDRVVAVKVMLPQYAADQTFQARFRQEAASAAKLQSPYIVSIYDWGLDAESDTYYIVMEYVRGLGFEFVDADCTIACQEPKISPHRDRMRANLSRALGVDIESVGVAATTTECLGWEGQGEGIGAWAVCLLEKKSEE